MIVNTECGPLTTPIRLGRTATTGDIVKALTTEERLSSIRWCRKVSLRASKLSCHPGSTRRSEEGPFLGRRTKRFSSIFDRSPLMAELAIWPDLLAAIEAVLPASRMRQARIAFSFT